MVWNHIGRTKGWVNPETILALRRVLSKSDKHGPREIIFLRWTMIPPFSAPAINLQETTWVCFFKLGTFLGWFKDNHIYIYIYIFATYSNRHTPWVYVGKTKGARVTIRNFILQTWPLFDASPLARCVSTAGSCQEEDIAVRVLMRVIGAYEKLSCSVAPIIFPHFFRWPH